MLNEPMARHDSTAVCESSTTHSSSVPMQPASLEIFTSKYALKDRHGRILELSINDTYHRVAQALAACESAPEEWLPKFIWALQNGAIPAGRITSNAGTEAHKPRVSLINCTVSATIHDSMESILGCVGEAGMTLKAGCGIGYEFSTLRPQGALVAGAGASTSGPLPFMDIFDRMCATVSSAGGRRGAQMATFDVSHPDVQAFIKAKREDGRLRQFNCSLLIPDAFMEAVEAGRPWHLVFPVMASECDTIDLHDVTQVVWRPWPVIEDGYTVDAEGLVACRIYKTVDARELFNSIMEATYNYAEPGVIFIDRVNAQNPLWFCENIRATNPCGEQPLPPHGSCLLGSVNLTKFVIDPFTEQARFDWQRYREVVRIFTRMLDNVADISGLPLEQQRAEILSKRRHGMGFLGLGSTLTMLRLRYGTPEAADFTAEVSEAMAVEGWRVGVELAKEKGPAPVLAADYTITADMLRRNRALATDGYKVGDTVKGSVLHACYGGAFAWMDQHYPDLRDALANHGCRFTHHMSIAPTGTISLSLANNASNGIEPSFAQKYSRNVIKAGRKTKEKVDVFSFELLAYRTYVNPHADPDSDDPGAKLPDYFVEADQISPEQHVSMQVAAQRFVDSAISKTINVATDIPFEQFRSIYSTAHRRCLKGLTTFRYNPEAFQGVLVKDKDLSQTTYQFTLDDGSVIEVKGNELVDYDGQIHTAANLFDALKEGLYGAF